MKTIYLSVVIPVFNEEQNLEPLFTRLVKVLDAVGKAFEIIFTNDGSRDRSMEILRGFQQHTAIMAAFERVRGEIIVTLDADLQNPPEEIPKLLKKMEEGFDSVGGVREERQDSPGRRLASRLINWARELTTDIKMSDQGCMLRAYRRHVIDAIVRTNERSLFIPALAYKFAARVPPGIRSIPITSSSG
jgi:undecaprenyl-phosphate 4-deoxy-4-formamido-L-arabinose transferase